MLERFLGEPGVGIDPGDDKNGEAVVDAPFDERLFRREVEHVKLVDPGRHDQDRALEHLLRRRRVLDELHQVVLEDHLAGRGREIAPDLEHRGVGLADLEVAVAGFDVLGQHVHAAREVGGIGAERLAQQLRIGQHEVRRRDRIDDLANVELSLLLGQRVEPLGVLDQVVGPFHRQQIGLLEEIEELVARPFRIGKALVARVGRRHRLRIFARHALHRSGPEIEIGPAQPELQFDRALRVLEPVFRDMAERFHDIDELGVFALDAALLARLHVGGERLAALFDHGGEVFRELLDIEGLALDRVRWSSHLDASFTSFRSGLVGSRSTYTFTWVCTVPVQDAYRESCLAPDRRGIRGLAPGCLSALVIY